MKVLVDSDFYIGMYLNSDIHNKTVQSILESLDESTVFYTTCEVVDEVSTKLSYNVSKSIAIKFLEDLDKLQTIIIHTDENLSELAISIFKKAKSKNVSLTDCFNTAVFIEYKLDCILSFDQYYKKL